jgi:hypothetical protein
MKAIIASYIFDANDSINWETLSTKKRKLGGMQEKHLWMHKRTQGSSAQMETF